MGRASSSESRPPRPLILLRAKDPNLGPSPRRRSFCGGVLGGEGVLRCWCWGVAARCVQDDLGCCQDRAYFVPDVTHRGQRPHLLRAFSKRFLKVVFSFLVFFWSAVFYYFWYFPPSCFCCRPVARAHREFETCAWGQYYPPCFV